MRALAGAVLFLLAACAAADPPAAAQAPVAEPPLQVVGPVAPPAPTPPAVPRESLDCAGAFTQGGTVLCRTYPGASISIDGAQVTHADQQGWAVIGFNREHGAEAVVRANVLRSEVSDGGPDAIAIGRSFSVEQRYAIAPREFDIQRINGLPQQTVTPTEPAVLARIQRDTALKQEAFRSEASLEGFLDGFIWPVEGGRISGRWGNQRVLNGTPSTPHFGVDIAAPTGTPIRAPAAGVVTLANPDMHYEGGLVFIDHGQGLITMYLHMSRLDVAVGEQVTQGQVIGAVGARGRATGPHLCWRMRWRERQLDPSVAIDGLAAARAQLLAAN